MTADNIIAKHNVEIQGSGSNTLVFGHGFGCDKTVWNKVIPEFTDQFHVISFDYIGCGRSDLSEYNNDKYDDLHAYANDLIALCDALNLESVYFIGHSVSGAIGMLASIQRPELFKKLITIGPSPHYLNETNYHGGFEKEDVMELLTMMQLNYFEWASYLAPVAVGNSEHPEFSEDIKLSFLRSDPVISENFAKVTFLCDIRNQLPNISVPVSVLYCTEDIIVPLEVIDYLAQQIPNCQTLKLEATGHYPQITNPKAVIAGIKHSITH